MAVSGVHHLPAVSSGTSTPAMGGSTQGRESYYTKGSIESLLPRCQLYHISDDSTPALDDAMRGIILQRASDCAAKGLRVLAMAYGFSGSASTLGHGTPVSRSRASSPAPGSTTTTTANLADSEPASLIFVGFQAMYDPPRKGVADSIEVLQRGGVQVVMITGDAEDTALAIGRQLGLKIAGGGRGVDRGVGLYPPVPPPLGEKGRAAAAATANGNGPAHRRHPAVLTGPEIDILSPSSLTSLISLGSISIFARTTPRHKMRIVKAYQALSHIVAMTGDGVNDAPALKLADIGVSMGSARATDVAKEAADVILVDDRFGTVVKAVEEGKSIFANVQNFLAFQLSTACAALGLVCLSTAMGLSNPLNAMQILFINILMDGEFLCLSLLVSGFS